MSGSFTVRDGFVDLPGVRLAYDICGSGACAVLVHGGLPGDIIYRNATSARWKLPAKIKSALKG